MLFITKAQGVQKLFSTTVGLTFKAGCSLSRQWIEKGSFPHDLHICFFPASVFFKRKHREKQFDTCIGHLNVVIFHIQFNVFMYYLQLITSIQSLLFKSDLLVSSFNTGS